MKRTLHIITGKPASGKSTFGKKLAMENNSTLLDSDTVTEKLIKTSLRLSGKDENDRDSLYYKENYRSIVYETLFDITEENIIHNNVIIIG
jgi:adenylate kinase family enzyme